MAGVTRRSFLAIGGFFAAGGLSVPFAHASRTIREVVRNTGPSAEERLRPYFASAGVPHPPPEITLVALKAERRLELWAPGPRGWRLVRFWKVLAASGGPGPKLREGDRQVPEGAYRIDAMNPNSKFHLSMRIDYPNARDRAQAAREGRTNLGGEIFIHGGAASIGCIAIGDSAIEELFVLVARVGPQRANVLVAPHDLRRRPAPADPRPWVVDLYADLTRRLAPFS